MKKHVDCLGGLDNFVAQLPLDRKKAWCFAIVGGGGE